MERKAKSSPCHLEDLVFPIGISGVKLIFRAFMDINFDLIPRNSSRLDRVHDLNATDRELSSQMPAVLYNQNKGRQVITLYFQQLAPRSSSQRRNNLIFQSLGCKKNCSFFQNLKFQNAQNRQPTEMKENERIEADLRSLLNLPSSVICSAANLNSSCAKNNLGVASWPFGQKFLFDSIILAIFWMIFSYFFSWLSRRGSDLCSYLYNIQA